MTDDAAEREQARQAQAAAAESLWSWGWADEEQAADAPDTPMTVEQMAGAWRQMTERPYVPPSVDELREYEGPND